MTEVAVGIEAAETETAIEGDREAKTAARERTARAETETKSKRDRRDRGAGRGGDGPDREAKIGGRVTGRRGVGGRFCCGFE